AAGVLTSVSQLCNLQAMDGNEVYLAHSMRPETPVNFRDRLDHRIKIIKVSLVRQIDPYKDFLGFLEVRKIIKEIEPDIIHLHSSKAGLLGRAAVFCGLPKKPKVFYSPRGFAFLQSDVGSVKRWLYFMLERIGSLLGGAIITCSKSEAGEAKKLKANNIHVIENAVNIHLIPVKKIKSVKDTQLNVGTSGRVCAQKNPALFKAIAERFLSKDKLQFIWIGGGGEDFNLGSAKNINLTGWLPRNRALTLLAELDIYVQTSLWEGMPISVIEAMVSGIPVVVTDVVGNRDAVAHGETGFITSSVEEMIYYIDLLAQDPELRLSMGQRARQVALKRFDLGRLKAEIDHLYLCHSLE
ncbi:MAG TPA: glycosyltransferase family 4 protein, partial [Clostridia bacterium]|nr:glycosyltransferase family 4 protein [Clostridia bacterium]